jgi:Ring finger domain
VQKTKMAAAAGAQALIIGNSTSEPWPYFMKYSQNEAAAVGAPGSSPPSPSSLLLIPTVMIKMADAQKLLQQMSSSTTNTSSSSSSSSCCNHSNYISCHLEITKAAPECVVCTDVLAESQTIVRLPACGHVFHESCALQWLTSHNTCPYCRRELPTDDAVYEQERRRRETSTAATISSSSGSGAGASHQYQDFYG